LTSHVGHKEKEKVNGHQRKANGKDLSCYSKRAARPEQVIPFDAEVSDF